MEILFLLLIIFIAYSNSINVQEIELGDISFKNLRTSTSPDFFYISINGRTIYNFIYFLFLDDSYNISYINFCFASSPPSDGKIGSCISSSHTYKHSKKKSEGILYHYELPILVNKSYIIINYSGKNSNGTFKAKSYFTEKVPIDSDKEFELSAQINFSNNFYAEIGNPSSNYIYFNITDLNNSLQQPIFYGLTHDNPKYHSPTFYTFLN